MGHWTMVRCCFERSVALDRERRARASRGEEARRARAAWFRQADDEIRSQLTAALSARARELAGLGAEVLVRPSYRRPGSCGSWCLELGYLGQCVWAYSARSEVGLQVYWAWVVKRPGTRFPKILSVPGFRVRPGPQQQLRLEVAQPSGGAAGVELDAAVCQLFGMLAEAATRRRLGA